MWIEWDSVFRGKHSQPGRSSISLQIQYPYQEQPVHNGKIAFLAVPRYAGFTV
jgi:hypothetical protein